MVALGLPCASVYLLTGHPRLTGEDVFGLESGEILALHTIVCLVVTGMSWMFSRSRAAMVSALILTSAWLASTGWMAPLTLGLSATLGGLLLIAGPDRRLWRLGTLIWIGLAALGGFGAATILELHQQPVALAIALVFWGSLIIYARVRKLRTATTTTTEAMLLTSLVGLLAIFATLGADPKAYSPAGFQMMALLAGLPSLLSLAVHSFRLAYIDELTEIPGRRALVEALDDPGSLFTLAMLDVDHFKQFNDTHGHDVGDQVLRMVAARIATVGEGGAAYRYGGEEFTLLFPGKSVDEVSQELERLRGLVESSPLFLRGDDRPKEKPKKAAPNKKSKSAGKKKPPSVGVTVSIGVATRRPSETWERVMKRADQALYKAKQAGRNQVSEAS